MPWTTKRTRIAGEVIRDGFARLADIDPPEMLVMSEESDWGLVGGDLRDAIDTVTGESVQPVTNDADELVEA